MCNLSARSFSPASSAIRRDAVLCGDRRGNGGQARGWANGTLGALDYLGAGFASLVFLAVNVLPLGWRALYVIGAVPLFLVAFLRRNLPETKRFAAQEKIEKARSKIAETTQLLRELIRQYPLRADDHDVSRRRVSALGPRRRVPVVGLSAKRDSLFAAAGELLFIPGGLVGRR